MSVMANRPVARWAVPAGLLVAIIGGGAVATTLSGSAQASLPERSPAQLLVDVATAQLDGASGTVVERADLGLPSLPASIGGSNSSQLNSLVSGSHTLRVWYSGPDRTRIALEGGSGESDIIRNGTDVWVWSSEDNTARHQKLPAKQPAHAVPTPTDLPNTPQQAANDVLSVLGQSTSVSVQQSTKVAGRGAYQLVLTPKDSGSLVSRVTIAIDGTRHIPLRVQVFAKGHAAPAFQIGFTSINFTRPDASRFQFSPPAGAKVTEGSTDSRTKQPEQRGAADKSATIGKGWTAVYAFRGQLPTGQGADQLNSFLKLLPEVHGAWGSGRLLQARLFSVLITDDGRVLVGAVNGATLTSVAAQPAAALK